MTTIESFFSLFPLQSAPANTTASFVGSLIPFLLVIGIFYFLIIRPQNKKQKETEKMLASLKKGDKVVTIGGVHGIIHAVKDSTVVLKVDDSTKIEFSRNAIASVLEAAKASSDEAVTTEEKK